MNRGVERTEQITRCGRTDRKRAVVSLSSSHLAGGNVRHNRQSNTKNPAHKLLSSHWIYAKTIQTGVILANSSRFLCTGRRRLADSD